MMTTIIQSAYREHIESYYKYQGVSQYDEVHITQLPEGESLGVCQG